MNSKNTNLFGDLPISKYTLILSLDLQQPYIYIYIYKSYKQIVFIFHNFLNEPKFNCFYAVNRSDVLLLFVAS